MGQFDLAIKDYTEAIKLDPNDDGSYLCRGMSYIQLSQPDPAAKMNFAQSEQLQKGINDLNEAIRINPNKPNYYLVRGNIYFHLGKHDLTKSDMEKIISMNPDDATLGIAQKILGQIN